MVHVAVADVEIEQLVERLGAHRFGRFLRPQCGRCDADEHKRAKTPRPQRSSHVFPTVLALDDDSSHISSDYTRWVRKPARAALNDSGCSRLDRCPARAMCTSSEPLIARCISSDAAGGVTRVFLTDDDQRRYGDGAKGRRIGPGHERADRTRNSLGRVGQREGKHLLHDRRPRLLRRRAKQLGDHFIGDGGRSLVLHDLQQPSSTGNAFGRVGLRSRVGEDEPLHVPRGEAQQRERHVAAHRQAAHHYLFQVQRVEQVDDVAGVVINRGGRRIAGATVEAAQLGRDHPPAGVGQGELPLPHTRVERKGMEEKQRAARALAGLRGCFEIAKSSDVWHPHIVDNVALTAADEPQLVRRSRPRSYASAMHTTPSVQRLLE